MDERDEPKPGLEYVAGEIELWMELGKEQRGATDRFIAPGLMSQWVKMLRSLAPTVGESSPGGDLPCPFCGAPASGDYCHPGFDFVRCSNDKTPHCPASFGCVQRKTWNHRAALSPSKAPVQMLCSVCKKEAVLTVCEDCQEKENHAGDGGDATPGMDHEEPDADQHMQWASNNDDLEHNFNLLHAYAKKLEAEVKRLRQSPPKGDPAAPSLLAGGRECWVMWYKGNPVGVSQSNPGSARGWVEWKRMCEVKPGIGGSPCDPSKSSQAQAGAQGDAT